VHDEVIDLCVFDVLLAEATAFQMVAEVRKTAKNSDMKILVASDHLNRFAQRNFARMGANDFIHEPFDSETLHQRLLYHLTPHEEYGVLKHHIVISGSNVGEHAKLLLEAIKLRSTMDFEELKKRSIELIGRVAQFFDSNRTSFIAVNPEQTEGIVVISSDHPGFCEFRLDMRKYPEILHVLNTGTIISVPDVSRNALTKDIHKHVKTIKIGSMVLFPVFCHGEICGVLTVRREHTKPLPPTEVLEVIQSFANTMGLKLRPHVLLQMMK